MITGAASYIDFIEEISPDDLYDGLVGYGLVGEKLPPVFSSESFLKLCKRKRHNFGVNKEGHGFITYRYAQNHHSYRLFGIPNPMAHELLCAEIRDHWEEIKKYFEKVTQMQHHKVSRLHLRKRPKKKFLFEMNYKNWKVDGEPVPRMLLGARFCVLTDISKCFPSIYTHAVEWALAGKESVKERRRQNIGGGWEEEIDKRLRCMTNNETHGILIGPHVSNLISEMVLCRIDSELSEKWNYVRYIDDIECYVSTRDDAENFIRDFDRSLSKYGLSRNTSKTKILDLPKSLQPSWVRALKRYPLPKEGELLPYSVASAFMDYVIDLEHQEDNLAVFNYAMKIISRRRVPKKAAEYLINICSHLASIYPYLMAHLENFMESLNCVDKSLLKQLSDMVYSRSINEGNYYSTYYVLYFAVKYGFELDAFNIDEVINSEDCMFKFFAMIYCRKKNKTAWTSMLKKNAEELEKQGEFDNNWIFCYEVLKENQLSGDWKYLKKEKVMFYDEAAFTAK